MASMTSARKTARYLECVVLVLVLLVPLFGSKLTTFLTTDVAIFALFAVSLNLLVGYTGLVSFGHAAYFGIGAYACALMLKNGLWFLLALPLGGSVAAFFALLFGYFCVRLTRVFFSMLTLAFGQISWAVCFKANELTGGDQGLTGVPYPHLAWMDALPVITRWSTSERYHIVVVVVVALGLWMLRRIVESPFGRILTMIRENPERAEFVGVNVRRYELAAFVIAGGFAGVAGALFGIFNRGVFPDLMYWTKGAEVLIMVLLGGMSFFYGPALGAFIVLWLSQEATAVTEYWSLLVGLVLMALLFFLPGGVADGAARLFGWFANAGSRTERSAASAMASVGRTSEAGE